MHCAAVWQHSSNSNIKIVHNSIEHFLWNPSDFFSDDVLSCLWIVFTNSVFQVPPQKIVRWVEILGIGWPRFVSLTQNESVPWKVMPEVFKCSVWETRRHLISLTEHLNTDYFLGGYLKDRVCESNPQAREIIIRKEIRRIPQGMLYRVVDNLNVRVAAVMLCSSAVHGTNIVLITEKV